MSSKGNSGQWQKVSSTGGKKGAKSSKGKKDAPKGAKPPPTVDSLSPLEIKPTSFDTFNKSEKPVTTIHSTTVTNNGDVKGSKAKKSRPVKQKPTSKFLFEKIEDALKQVSLEDVLKRADEAKITNTSHLIYLKEIATIYNASLSCPEISPALTAKESGFPSSNIAKGTNTKLHKLFVASTSINDQLTMFKFCLENMLKCIENDTPSWGFRICLQVLAHNCASQCCVGLRKHLDDITHRINVPKRCLAYIWALGQLGHNNPKIGMEVWLNIMVPLLHIKNLAEYSVGYVEQLIVNTNKPEKHLSGTISADQLILIMQYCFDNSRSLNKNLRARLCKLYPLVKDIAVEKHSEELFAKILESSTAESDSLKCEYVEVAVSCLDANTQCFPSWRKLYLGSFPMTRELLMTINDRWDNGWQVGDSDEFVQTVENFIAVNNKAAQSSQTITSKREFKDISRTCEQLQEKFSQESSPSLQQSSILSTAVFVVLVAILTTFLYDLYLHSGVYEETTTHRKLEEFKINEKLQAALLTAKLYAVKAEIWFRLNLAPTVLKVWQSILPYILSLGEVIYNAAMWLVVNTEEIREVSKVYVKEALEWMDVALRAAYELLLPYTTVAVEAINDFASRLINGEISWCCVKGFVYNFYLAAWSHAASAWSSAMDYVSGTEL